MSYVINDLNVSASTKELAAIKVALASILYSLHTPERAKDVIATIRSCEFKEALELADEIEKFSPENATHR